MSDLDRDDAATADAIAQHLTGRLAAGIDPALVAGHLIELIRKQGWRQVRPPEQDTARRPGDPPNTEWRQARRNLARTEGDPDA